jgi:hypothetical protein
MFKPSFRFALVGLFCMVSQRALSQDATINTSTFASSSRSIEYPDHFVGYTFPYAEEWVGYRLGFYTPRNPNPNGEWGQRVEPAGHTYAGVNSYTKSISYMKALGPGLLRLGGIIGDQNCMSDRVSGKCDLGVRKAVFLQHIENMVSAAKWQVVLQANAAEEDVYSLTEYLAKQVIPILKSKNRLAFMTIGNEPQSWSKFYRKRRAPGCRRSAINAALQKVPPNKKRAVKAAMNKACRPEPGVWVGYKHTVEDYVPVLTAWGIKAAGPEFNMWAGTPKDEDRDEDNDEEPDKAMVPMSKYKSYMGQMLKILRSSPGTPSISTHWYNGADKKKCPRSPAFLLSDASKIREFPHCNGSRDPAKYWDRGPMYMNGYPGFEKLFFERIQSRVGNANVYISETSTFSGRGFAGVSDSAVSAIWAVDHIARAATMKGTGGSRIRGLFFQSAGQAGGDYQLGCKNPGYLEGAREPSQNKHCLTPRRRDLEDVRVSVAPYNVFDFDGDPRPIYFGMWFANNFLKGMTLEARLKTTYTTDDKKYGPFTRSPTGIGVGLNGSDNHLVAFKAKYGTGGAGRRILLINKNVYDADYGDQTCPKLPKGVWSLINADETYEQVPGSTNASITVSLTNVARAPKYVMLRASEPCSMSPSVGIVGNPAVCGPTGICDKTFFEGSEGNRASIDSLWRTEPDAHLSGSGATWNAVVPYMSAMVIDI